MNIDSDADAEEVARWAVLLDEAELAAVEREALDAWLAERPARAGALLRARAVLAYLDRGRALMPTAPDEPAIPRRTVLRWTGAVAAAACVGIAMLLPRGERFTTTVGEIRRVPLADGSVASLNTRSSLTVRLATDRREVTLDDGEAWFQVAHDRSRPFLVRVGDLRVRAVGTAFSVRRLPKGGADILVTEGVVAAWREGSAGPPVLIAAGHRGLANAASPPAGLPAVRTEEAPRLIERALAWRSGELALDGDSLSAAVDEINRYNRLRIEVEPDLGRQRLVGYFRLSEPEQFALAAAAMTGGRVRHVEGGIRIER